MKKLKILLLLSFVIIVVSGCTSANKTKTTKTTRATGNNQLVQDSRAVSPTPLKQFSGVVGTEVFASNGNVSISKKLVGDDDIAYLNYLNDNGKRIYFMIVRDDTGTYRAAANACEVCHGAMMGFRKEGDFMVCNTCGNKYPLNKVSEEKGGCNPGPITTKVETVGGNLVLTVSQINSVDYLF